MLKTGLIYLTTALLLFTFCMEASASRSRISSKKGIEAVSFVPSESLPLEENIINYSKLYLGRPYRSGSKGPGRFDCSGFTHFIFSKFDYKIGASSGIQATEGYRLEEDEIHTGDLIFFKGRNSKANRVGHVGIVLSKEDDGSIRFIHSSCNKGVCISNSGEPYYKLRYVGCNRIIRKEETDRPHFNLQYLYPSVPSCFPKLMPQESIKNELSFLK